MYDQEGARYSLHVRLGKIIFTNLFYYLVFFFFFLLFMSLTALFVTIHESYCTF